MNMDWEGFEPTEDPDTFRYYIATEAIGVAT